MKPAHKKLTGDQLSAHNLTSSGDEIAKNSQHQTLSKSISFSHVLQNLTIPFHLVKKLVMPLRSKHAQSNLCPSFSCLEGKTGDVAGREMLE